MLRYDTAVVTEQQTAAFPPPPLLLFASLLLHLFLLEGRLTAHGTCGEGAVVSV
jgi:hypothetical protein